MLHTLLYKLLVTRTQVDSFVTVATVTIVIQAGGFHCGR